MNKEHDDSKNGYINNLNQVNDDFEGHGSAPEDLDNQQPEQYAEPQNDYYTTEYNQQSYFTANESQEQDGDAGFPQEASIFGEKSEPEFLAEGDLYSTELPTQNYTNAYTTTENNDSNEMESVEYAEVQDQNGAVYQSENEQYVDAEQYAEPAQYVEHAYVEQAYDAAGFEGKDGEANYIYADEQGSSANSLNETQFEQPQYENASNLYDTNLVEHADTRQQINADLVGEDYTEYQDDGYIEESDSFSSNNAQDYYNDETQNEQAYVNAPIPTNGYESRVDEQSFVSQQNSTGFLPQGDDYSQNDAPNLHQQNFAQEYLNESKPQKTGLPIGWMVSGVGVIAVLVGVYFGYSSLNSTDGQLNVPFVEADKSDIKIVPKTVKTASRDSGNIADKNIGELPQTPDETVLNSRETVVEQPIKTDDRVEVSTYINVDNDDKDIQNVLTLLKSNVNNAEILLKPDEINVIDQNKIGIEGLETILVDAKQVSLNDINGNNQATQVVKTAGVDDLVVIGEGNDDPFTQVINSDPVAELPDVAPEPLPDISVASLDLTQLTAQDQSRDILTEVVKQIVTNAPKPIKRPVVRNVSPTVVPNSLTPNAVASGDYGVQLASLPTESGARQAYVKALKQFPNILASFSPVIKEAVVPGKGVFYRVFAGPLNSYSDANELCATLRASGISGCFARKM